MKKILKRLCTGVLALATVVTTLPSTPVHAESIILTSLLKRNPIPLTRISAFMIQNF